MTNPGCREIAKVEQFRVGGASEDSGEDENEEDELTSWLGERGGGKGPEGRSAKAREHVRVHVCVSVCVCVCAVGQTNVLWAGPRSINELMN